MIFRQLRMPLNANPADALNLQEQHDQAFLALNAWLGNHKGFSDKEARALASQLDYAYTDSLHDKVQEMMTAESSYNEFLYHFIQFGAPYQSSDLTVVRLIERVNASETTIANLRFCRLGTLPLLSLQEIFSNIPEHITTIDFSYNIFNADFNEIIDVLIQSGKTILLDDLPFTKQLEIAMNARKYNLLVSEVLTSAHYCEMNNQTPNNDAGAKLFNFFRPTSSVNSQVKSYCLGFIKP